MIFRRNVKNENDKIFMNHAKQENFPKRQKHANAQVQGHKSTYMRMKNNIEAHHTAPDQIEREYLPAGPCQADREDKHGNHRPA